MCSVSLQLDRHCVVLYVAVSLQLVRHCVILYVIAAGSALCRTVCSCVIAASSALCHTVCHCVIAASSALCHFSHPLMKVQPVDVSSRQTKLKAKRLSGQLYISSKRDCHIHDSALITRQHSFTCHTGCAVTAVYLDKSVVGVLCKNVIV